MQGKEQILEHIHAFVREYQKERELTARWKQPLMGFADVNSPYIRSLKELISPTHYLPEEFLPDCKTILCYFFPFTEEIARSNEEGEEPSAVWVRAYQETNQMFAELNQSLAELFASWGYRAVSPDPVGMIDEDHIYSNWFQRHIAYAAGLGTFGMNNMLITEAGTCGRFYSLITDYPADTDGPVPEERCLYKRNGSCGLCVRRCPVHALTLESGFDRVACQRHLVEFEKRLGADVCGKCTLQLPCTYRIPNGDGA